ncbi:hypothetical protein XENORESO_019638, partial [Xenotaenia resolanae]
NQMSGFTVHIILKILGIIMLYSTIILLESWFRFFKKPKMETQEPTYVNSVMAAKAS